MEKENSKETIHISFNKVDDEDREILKYLEENKGVLGKATFAKVLLQKATLRNDIEHNNKNLNYDEKFNIIIKLINDIKSKIDILDSKNIDLIEKDEEIIALENFINTI